jgi:hypothetical protein
MDLDKLTHVFHTAKQPEIAVPALEAALVAGVAVAAPAIAATAPITALPAAIVIATAATAATAGGVVAAQGLRNQSPTSKPPALPDSK